MQIKESITQTLVQLEKILIQLSDEDYTKQIELINHQNIGKHVRHIVEFFQCLLIADEIVCFDNRKRELLLETSIPYTLQIVNQIKDEIQTIDFNKKITLKQLVNQEILEVESSVGRELIYCIDHSIHHFAIIKMILKIEFPKINLNDDFGIAYSTINYNSK